MLLCILIVIHELFNFKCPRDGSEPFDIHRNVLIKDKIILKRNSKDLLWICCFEFLFKKSLSILEFFWTSG